MTDETRLLCPYGCNSKILTLRGWKQHMSGTHGSYTQEELNAAANMTPAEPDARQRMDEFANTLVSESQTDSPAPVEAGTAVPQPQLPNPNVRKIRATPRKLKKLLASIPTDILKQNDITPDEEDAESIEEAAEFLQDCFGFEFEIPEEKVTVHSRWWAFVWVVGVIALVVIKHKFQSIFTLGGLSDDETKTE